MQSRCALRPCLQPAGRSIQLFAALSLGLPVRGFTGSPRRAIRHNENPTPGPLKTKRGLIQTVMDGLARIFGQDKKSIERRKRRRQIDSAVNRVFEGTGLLGTLISGIVKRVGYMITSMMEESADDLSKIQTKIVSSLSSDSACSSFLGDDIQCSAPTQLASSSSSINGVKSRSYLCVMEVSGTRNSGRVGVEAKIGSDGILRISELTFQGTDGRLRVLLSD